VEVADDGKLGNITEKPLDPAMGARVADDPAMFAPGALEGKRMLDDVHLLPAATVAIPDEETEALALVDLHRGDQETPECVL
jgi:hypothetical protein